MNVIFINDTKAHFISENNGVGKMNFVHCHLLIPLSCAIPHEIKNEVFH